MTWPLGVNGVAPVSRLLGIGCEMHPTCLMGCWVGLRSLVLSMRSSWVWDMSLEPIWNETVRLSVMTVLSLFNMWEISNEVAAVRPM